MTEFDKWRESQPSPYARAKNKREHDKKVWNAAIMAAKKIAEIGTSKTPEPNGIHSIRTRISKAIEKLEVKE